MRLPAQSAPGAIRADRRPARLYMLLLSAVVLAGCADLPSTPAAPEAPEPEGPQLTFGTSGVEIAHRMAIHSSGVYVAGYTTGELDGPHRGGGDSFIRKYHPEGDVLWADQFGSNLDDIAYDVAVDGSGRVYVVGATSGSLAGSRGGFDGFVRKYNANGTLQWTRQFGTATYDRAWGAAADASGNLYVVGETTGSLGGAYQGGFDAFVRKYSASGDVLWTRQIGTSWDEAGQGVAVDATGAAYVTGYTSGELQGTNSGGGDVFLRKYDPMGNVIWTRQFGTVEWEVGFGVAASSAGNVYVVGYTLGSIAGGNAGFEDAFIRKYSGDGVKLWTSQFGSPGEDYARSVAVDDTDRAYVIGFTEGSLEGPNAGANDTFVRKYRASGTVAWATQFGTAASDLGYAVATLTGSQVFVAGGTAGTLVGANQGGFDAFIRQLTGGGSTVWTDQ
jgi:hypothetical protein